MGWDDPWLTAVLGALVFYSNRPFWERLPTLITIPVHGFASLFPFRQFGLQNYPKTAIKSPKNIQKEALKLSKRQKSSNSPGVLVEQQAKYCRDHCARTVRAVELAGGEMDSWDHARCGGGVVWGKKEWKTRETVENHGFCLGKKVVFLRKSMVFPGKSHGYPVVWKGFLGLRCFGGPLLRWLFQAKVSFDKSS